MRNSSLFQIWKICLALILLFVTGCTVGEVVSTDTALAKPPSQVAPSQPAQSSPSLATGGATPTTQTALPATTHTPTSTLIPSPLPTFTATAAPIVELPAYLQSTWIAFISNLDSGVYIVRADGTGLRNVYMEPGAFLEDRPAWSPDGHRLAFVYALPYTPAFKNGSIQIFTIGIDGKNLRQLTDESDRQNLSPAWSPDGKWIVYLSGYILNRQEIVDIKIRNAEGGPSHYLVKNGFSNDDPVWSRDGKTIYYLSNKPDGQKVHLMAINSDGSGERSVMDFPNSYFPSSSLSPDGNRLLLSSAETSTNGPCLSIAILNIEDKKFETFLDFPGDQAWPSWSPDSRYITLNARNKKECFLGGMDAYIMDLQTRAMKELIQNKNVYTEYPVWSPVPALQTNRQYVITELGDRLNLRESAALNGALIRQLRKGEMATILEGPLDYDNYYWWRMRTADGLEGWAVEVAGWYEPAK